MWLVLAALVATLILPACRAAAISNLIPTAVAGNLTIARKTNVKIIVIVVGTRPEVIKMAPVIKEFKERTKDFYTVVVSTGQHRQMLNQVLRTFGLENSIDISLDVMKENQQLLDLTTVISTTMSTLLGALKPHYMIVQGDTTTSFAASMAAFYLHIPVAHVEAGLRTWNHLSPFPEEFNRQAISSMATVHFAATDWAANNLLSEKRLPSSVYVTGNPVVDSLHMIASGKYGGRSVVLERVLRLAKMRGVGATTRIVLLTAHRRENLFGPIHSIMKAVFQLLQTYPDIVMVYPVHKNPNVRDSILQSMPHAVFQNIIDGTLQKDPAYGYLNRLLLIDPLDYTDLLHLMVECVVILTDSGGLQEEGTSLGKPIFILRGTTERPEAVQSKAAILVGTETAAIFGNVTLALKGQGLFLTARPSVVYGDGKAAVKIANLLHSRKPELTEAAPNSSSVQSIDSDGLPCDLVVLFTVWRRGTMLETQLGMLNAQSLLKRIKRTCVIVFQNGAHVDVGPVVKKWSAREAWGASNVEVTFIHSPHVETGYYGRFLTPLTANAAKGAYFVVADDDILWGTHYLENMIRVVDEGYLATRNGRFVHPDGREDYIADPYSFWKKGLKVTFEVDADYDFGGHTWTGRLEWLKKAWTRPPVSYENCEDFWISAVLKSYQGIRTRSPRCPEGRPELCACSHNLADERKVAKIGKTEAQQKNHNDIMALIVKTYDYGVLMQEDREIQDKVSKLYMKVVGTYDSTNATLAIFKDCLYWA